MYAWRRHYGYLHASQWMWLLEVGRSRIQSVLRRYTVFVLDGHGCRWKRAVKVMGNKKKRDKKKNKAVKAKDFYDSLTKPIVVKPPAQRNPYALSAKTRRAEKFKDKRTGKGGSKSKWEYEEE